MRVVYTTEALQSPDGEVRRELLAIVHFFVDGRHRWEIPDFEELERSPWFREECPPSLKEFYRKALVAQEYPTSLHRWRLRVLDRPGSAHPELLPVLPEGRGAGEIELPARRARLFLEEPLHVCVENASSDRKFLEVLLLVFGPGEVAELLDPELRALSFSSRGGITELPKLVEALLDEARQRGHPARLFVLFDSDAREPGELPGKVLEQERKLRKSFEEGGLQEFPEAALPFHRLEKRANENYLPDPALEAWARGKQAQQRAFVEALRALSREQRDHLDIKRGLSRSSSSLFQDLPAELRRKLEPGAGRKAEPSEAWGLLRKGLEEGIEGLPATREELAGLLEGRDGKGELRRLVSRLLSLL